MSMATDHQTGLLNARPGAAPALDERLAPGLHPLGSDQARDGLIHVPARRNADAEVPLLVMLHGAGGTAGQVVPLVREAADRHGVVVLAPDSRDRGSWDVIRDGAYGRDVAFLDAALASLFARCRVRPDRIAIGGFSDGASYALSLALINGAFFRAALAFSPGFAAPTTTADHPEIFISHGTRDEVLPIDPCGRRLARVLTEVGYRVTYREFDGGHVVPPDLVDAAFSTLLDAEL
jgi:predicted esterase